jgi:hypothetical protein
MTTCTLNEGHDCANVRQANDALRRHLDRACNDRDAASAEVARLREERDGWKKGVEDANRISQRERATAERIAEALRPLAALAAVDMGPDYMPENEAFIHWAGQCPLTWGDVRRARAALASLGSPRGSPQDERNPTPSNEE